MPEPTIGDLGMNFDADCCPRCGYTYADACWQMDHHHCIGEIPIPTDSLRPRCPNCLSRDTDSDIPEDGIAYCAACDLEFRYSRDGELYA